MELNTIALYITIIAGVYSLLSGFNAAEKTFLRMSASYSKYKEKLQRVAWALFALGVGYLIFTYSPNNVEKIIPLSDIRGAEFFKCESYYCARIAPATVGILKILNDPQTPSSSLTFHFEPASSFEANWNGHAVKVINGELQAGELLATNTLVIGPLQDGVNLQNIRVDTKVSDDRFVYMIAGLAVIAYGILMLFNRHDKTVKAIYGEKHVAREMIKDEIKKYIKNDDESDRKILIEGALKTLKRKFGKRDISKEMYLAIREQASELMKENIADFNKGIYEQK